MANSRIKVLVAASLLASFVGGSWMERRHQQEAIDRAGSKAWHDGYEWQISMNSNSAFKSGTLTAFWCIKSKSPSVCAAAVGDGNVGNEWFNHHSEELDEFVRQHGSVKPIQETR